MTLARSALHMILTAAISIGIGLFVPSSSQSDQACMGPLIWGPAILDGGPESPLVQEVRVRLCANTTPPTVIAETREYERTQRKDGVRQYRQFGRTIDYDAPQETWWFPTRVIELRLVVVPVAPDRSDGPKGGP